MVHLHELDFVDFFEENLDRDDFHEILRRRIAFSCKGSKCKARGRFSVHQCSKEIYRLMDKFKSENISSFLEVGVEFGGMFFCMDSFLRSVNPDFEGSTGLDIKTTELMESRYPNYHAKYPTAKYVIGDCFDFAPDKKYDFIFIDNNLKYNRMKECFHQYLPHATRYIGFHDIKDGRYGAKRLWEELEQEYETETFVHSLAGIGLITL